MDGKQEKLEKQLLDDVKMLSDTIGPHSSLRYEELCKAAQYIEQRLANTSLQTNHQTYKIGDKEFKNLSFSKSGGKQEILLIGAHYDTVEDKPGADDNTSAVAVLLALANELSNYHNQHTLYFVFFTLEEPPHFRTETMGSFLYAQMLRKNEANIKLMIGLEMLGFYSDEEIQEYPTPLLSLLYPKEGNFIAVTSINKHSEITKKFFNLVKKHNSFDTQILITPDTMLDVHLSDHESFWKFNYPALMVTDSAFYRNKNYHTYSDTYDTLDYKKMAKLTQALVAAIKDLDKEN